MSTASIGDALTDVFGNAVEIIVRVLVCLLIMTLGWFAARLIHGGLRKLLIRVGFDRVVDRGGMPRVTGLRSASDLAAKLVRYGLLLLTLHLAFGVFGPNPVSDLIRAVLAWLPSLVIALVIVVIAVGIAGAAKDVVSRALHGLGYGRPLALIAQIAIVGLGLIAALHQIGVATAVTMPLLIAALATGGGILIVGLGGGLIKPMQQRWERVLSRAESEAPTAVAKVRANIATRDRPTKATDGFGQAAYGGGSTGAAAQDTQVPATPPTDVTPVISKAEWLTRDAD